MTEHFTQQQVQEIVQEHVTANLVAEWHTQLNVDGLTIAGLMAVQARLADPTGRLRQGPDLDLVRQRVSEALAEALPDDPEGLAE
jgi:hypothetical protein